MSMHRSFAGLIAVVTCLSLGTVVHGESGQEHMYQALPFIDPGYFQPDFQFFAPAEVSDFSGGEPPNSGIYVTFDRTYVNVSRPHDQFSFGSANQGDFTWGNRMEVGYMLDDPRGWQAVLWHVNGPNELFPNSASQVLTPNLPGTVSIPIVTDQAFDTLNRLKMSSFELNKVWRRPQLHGGGFFEPFVGYRYMNVRDFWQRENFLEIVGIPPNTEFFAKDTFQSQFENNMHGGQIGARLFRQRGHWLLSADFKFFTLANFQTLKRVHQQSVLPNPDEQPANGEVDIIAPLPLPFPTLPSVGGDVNRVIDYQRATQFCFGGEVKAEASYELTREINLRFGLVFLDLGQGIGRGNQLRLNNQAVQMAGATFGFTINR